MKEEKLQFENGCERSSEILPYIYRENSHADRDIFDAHLADCAECRDEFAAMSFSRYSVYEWQREEFASLATPDLAAVFATKVSDGEPLGWLDGIREWFTLPQRLAFAGGFAAIAVGIISGAFYLSSSDQAATPDIVKENEVTISQPTIDRGTAPIPEIVQAPDAMPERAKPAEAVRTLSKPVNRKAAVNRGPADKKPSESSLATVQPADLPRLTEDDDDLDYGLRLSDLVADIETREDK